MSFLSGLGDILKQYSTPNANAPSEQVEQHFDQVAQSVPSSTLASGLSEAFRSGQTPPFSQMAATMFSNANGQQRASLLSTLAASVGPAVLARFAGSNPHSPLASMLGSGQTTISPAQAAQVDPADVAALAQHAEQHNPSIVDRVSEVYAQHPTLIKSLGVAAMSIAMSKISQQHQ